MRDLGWGWGGGGGRDWTMQANREAAGITQPADDCTHRREQQKFGAKNIDQSKVAGTLRKIGQSQSARIY